MLYRLFIEKDQQWHQSQKVQGTRRSTNDSGNRFREENQGSGNHRQKRKTTIQGIVLEKEKRIVFDSEYRGEKKKRTGCAKPPLEKKRTIPP